MSVRSTNVYEEKSLGVYVDPGHDDDKEEPSGDGHPGQVWGSYLAWHIRRQLAFGELSSLCEQSEHVVNRLRQICG